MTVPHNAIPQSRETFQDATYPFYGNCSMCRFWQSCNKYILWSLFAHSVLYVQNIYFIQDSRLWGTLAQLWGTLGHLRILPAIEMIFLYLQLDYTPKLQILGTPPNSKIEIPEEYG